MRLSVKLLFILITSALLTLVLSDAENRDKPVARKRKGAKLLKDEDEVSKKVQSYESEDDEHVYKRGNKYKDVSDEEDSEEEVKMRPKGFKWNRNFKNHKSNTYEEFDQETGAFKDTAKPNELKKQAKSVDKDGPKKYLKSKNDKSSKEITRRKKNFKAKYPEEAEGSSEETEAKSVGKNLQAKVRELRPLEKVRTRSAPVRKSEEKKKQKETSEEDDDESNNVETEETDEDSDEDDDGNSDGLQCDSLEENCDVRM